MYNNTLTQQQEEARENIPEEMKDSTFTEDDYSYQMPPEDVVAFNEQRSCYDLVRMHERKILNIHPAFQRDFVWGDPEQTRFIDSLIKRLPMPSMCIAVDQKKDEWIVIDGLQRISTIVRFLGKQEKPWRLSKLDNIDQNISGRTPDEIEKKMGYVSRVENHALPISVLRCDLEKPHHFEYIIMIFHRLNTRGLKLNNQEIRNCIFGGEFNQLLHELDQTRAWRRLNHMKSDNNYRFVKQELILRFFAFYYRERDSYKGRMAKFLDKFMHEHRKADEETLSKMRDLFERVISVFAKIFPDGEPKKPIPANTMSPVMVGIAKNIDFLEGVQVSDLRKRYRTLTKNEAFSEGAARTSHAKFVQERLQTAAKIFGTSP